jgi:hypothetical protein
MADGMPACEEEHEVACGAWKLERVRFYLVVLHSSRIFTNAGGPRRFMGLVSVVMAESGFCFFCRFLSSCLAANHRLGRVYISCMDLRRKKGKALLLH